LRGDNDRGVRFQHRHDQREQRGGVALRGDGGQAIAHHEGHSGGGGRRGQQGAVGRVQLSAEIGAAQIGWPVRAGTTDGDAGKAEGVQIGL
jgi:hypothetical protein